jgi:hypothetical protein
VVVKFNRLASLKINQSTIIANGTALDSITFTADTTAPYQGFWGSIYLNQGTVSSFKYCAFRYGTLALNASTNDTLMLKNSLFEFNHTAMNASQCAIDTCVFRFNYAFGIGDLYYSKVHFCVFADNENGIGNTGYSALSNCFIECNNSGFSGGSAGSVSMLNLKVNHNNSGIVGYGDYTVKNCIIDSNTTVGISLNGINDTLENCEIKANASVGLVYNGSQSFFTLNDIENNGVGIMFGGTNDSIACNKICSNTSYNVEYILSGNTHDLHNNYWCSTDTVAIAATIFDHVQDTAEGLVFLGSIETVACNNMGPTAFALPNYTSTCSNFLSVPVITNQKNFVTIFPNPFKDFTTLKIEGAQLNSASTLHIYNLLGEEVRKLFVGSNTMLTISRESLSRGMYFYKLIDADAAVLGMGKLVIE